MAFGWSLLTVALVAGAKLAYNHFPEESGTQSMLPGNANLFVLLAGCFLLVSLSLLVRDFHLKPHAIILLIAICAHLIVAVYHYIFIGSNRAGLVSFDIYYLVIVLGITLLLTRRYRLLPKL